MLRSTKDLQDYSIDAIDGTIGKVSDLYFDDDAWVVRYLVVDTGSWLSSRRVLVSLISVGTPDGALKSIPVVISKEQVRHSPDIDTDKPVSRQHEIHYLGYYGYPPYWDGIGMWGGGLEPFAMQPGYLMDNLNSSERLAEQEAYAQAERARHRNDDPHLRSCKAVSGYHIKAKDGEIGHVEDFLIDDRTWALRYIVVNTSNWWLGHKVLIAPQWIKAVHWSDESVLVDLNRATIQDAPAFESTAALNRAHEIGLYHHYGRTGYWARDPAP